MRKVYIRPSLLKASVTLQAVTAIVNSSQPQ
jgi:hypothetical protein